jgi:hypothetical protein
MSSTSAGDAGLLGKVGEELVSDALASESKRSRTVRMSGESGGIITS